MLPDKNLGCHRTGFAKSCRSLLASGKCRRWRMVLGEDPQTAAPLQAWDCIDNHAYVIALSTGRALEQLTASTDKAHNADERRHAEQTAAHTQLALALADTSYALGSSGAPLRIGHEVKQ